jgi:hypothetical protein
MIGCRPGTVVLIKCSECVDGDELVNPLADAVSNGCRSPVLLSLSIPKPLVPISTSHWSQFPHLIGPNRHSSLVQLCIRNAPNRARHGMDLHGYTAPVQLVTLRLSSWSHCACSVGRSSWEHCACPVGNTAAFQFRTLRLSIWEHCACAVGNTRANLTEV